MHFRILYSYWSLRACTCTHDYICMIASTCVGFDVGISRHVRVISCQWIEAFAYAHCSEVLVLVGYGLDMCWVTPMCIRHTCMCILRAISRHVQMLSEGICAISCQGVGIGEMLGWIGYGLGMLCRIICLCILENIAAHYMIRIYIALQHSSRLLIARNKERDVVTLHVCVFASCVLLARARVRVWHY